MHINPEIMVANRGALLAAKKSLLATANVFLKSKPLEEKMERAIAERADLRILHHLKRTVKLAEKISPVQRLEDKHETAYRRCNLRCSPDQRAERLRSGKLPNLDMEGNLLEMHHLCMKLADHHAKLANGSGRASEKIEYALAVAYYCKAISISRKLMAWHENQLNAACSELKEVDERCNGNHSHTDYDNALRKFMAAYRRILDYAAEMYELKTSLGAFKARGAIGRELEIRKDSVLKEFDEGLLEKAYRALKLPFVPQYEVLDNPREYLKHGN